MSSLRSDIVSSHVMPYMGSPVLYSPSYEVLAIFRRAGYKTIPKVKRTPRTAMTVSPMRRAKRFFRKSGSQDKSTAMAAKPVYRNVIAHQNNMGDAAITPPKPKSKPAA